jgi:hypothetical protein
MTVFNFWQYLWGVLFTYNSIILWGNCYVQWALFLGVFIAHCEKFLHSFFLLIAVGDFILYSEISHIGRFALLPGVFFCHCYMGRFWHLYIGIFATVGAHLYTVIGVCVLMGKANQIAF